jgi:hypothetical protein
MKKADPRQLSLFPADRAAGVRAEIERIFGRKLSGEARKLADLIIREALAEHEIDVRREYKADE